ncbi:hypothetical protein [Actinomadura madurae]|uniref:hypothetical protein n=1 Tax=Actinomadura madurae TaxID=1993 RepID=UPI0020D1FCE4|nr:hypothetical protein [Actinomadura madurae]MCP9976488.1 hypothetical protein [Actinomadura madurae]
MDAFHNHERLRELINPAHDMARRDTTGEMVTWGFWFERALTHVSETYPLLTYRGHQINGGDLLLNTALAVGSDPVKLLARIDGQCELHGYVEGPNRAWLADIIDQGLADGVLRRTLRYQPHPDTPREDWPTRPLGWDDVTAFLRARDDEPVVMSDSTMDGFPNSDIAEWQPPAGTDLCPGWAAEDPDEWAPLSETERAEWEQTRALDLWAELPKDERWDLAMTGLRARSARGSLLELTPDGWVGYRFGHSLTIFDLYADDYQDRIEATLGLDPASSSPR